MNRGGEVERYYVVCPFEDEAQGIPLAKYIFGPYSDSGKAYRALEELHGWEVISLPTKNIDEAVKILNEST